MAVLDELCQAEDPMDASTHLYQCRWLPEFGIDLRSNAKFSRLAFNQTFCLLPGISEDSCHLLNDPCRIRPNPVQLVDETDPGNGVPTHLTIYGYGLKKCPTRTSVATA
jgi:hypothetical protein